MLTLHRATLTYTKILVGKDKDIIELTTTLRDTALMPLSKNGVITLKDDSLEIVTYFLHWAKSGGEICSSSEKGHDDEFDFLVHLYCFGHKHNDTRFKEADIDAFPCCCLLQLTPMAA